MYLWALFKFKRVCLWLDVPLVAGERFGMKYMFGRAVLTIKHLRPDDSGVYMVKAHNGAGNIQSTATLHVQPQLERGGAIAAYGGGANVTSSTTSSYTNGHFGSQNTTTYNTTSTTVIQTAPTFMRHLEPDYNVLEGSRLHMEVRAEPTHGQDLVFTWLKNGAPIQSGTLRISQRTAAARPLDYSNAFFLIFSIYKLACTAKHSTRRDLDP